MRRRLILLFLAAFVAIFGTAACGGVEEEVQKQVEEKVGEGQ